MSCPAGGGHMPVPGAPIVHPDGSQTPTIICGKCQQRLA